MCTCMAQGEQLQPGREQHASSGTRAGSHDAGGRRRAGGAQPGKAEGKLGSVPACACSTGAAGLWLTRQDNPLQPCECPTSRSARSAP